MSYLKKPLEHYAGFLCRHYKFFLIFVFLFTAIISFGVGNLGLESDIQEQLPQDLPIFQLNERIDSNFAGQDTIFLLFMLNEDVGIRETPKDILEPGIMEYLLNLESVLEKESKIHSINSIAPVIESAKKRHSELTSTIMAEALENSPEGDALVSSDRRKTIMMLSTNVGDSERQIEEVNEMIDEKLDALSKPAGTKIMVTGNPPLQNTILGILRHDAVYTLAIAFVIIFAILVVLQQSFRWAFLVAFPLLLAILWTAGTLGWLDIKISFATAGLGAMVLGLGVEYGAFMLSRFREEKEKHSHSKNCPLKSLKETIPNVGSAIIGSGSTTIVGFLALTLSIMPMMQNLGLSLAIGIFYCILSMVLVMPALLLANEKITGGLK
ncbi:MAG: efflux RND transporter permease subunit [Nanoarchaeota archaeon]